MNDLRRKRNMNEYRIKVWVGLSPKSTGVYTKEFRKLSLYIVKTALNTSMKPQSLSYMCIRTNFAKGLRKGNWRKQRLRDKALYRAAMWYAKHGGSILDSVCLGTRVEELVERPGLCVLVGMGR